MIRECIAEAMRNPAQFAAEFGTLVLCFASVMALLFALAPMPVQP